MPAIWPYFTDEEFEMVGQDTLPNFPTPIVIHDTRGRPRWTVSIPPNHDFPLSTQQYADMSGQCREVSARARDLHTMAALPEKITMDYDAPDDYFVDVAKAERTGLLAGAPAMAQPNQDAGHFAGVDPKTTTSLPVCKSSMTYVLESTDAGLGNTLMMLWTFYGLAKKEGRPFFIEDSRWAYGSYTEIFQAPPVPQCRPPPRHQMVPCPFQTQHLVVSGMTAKDIFPSLLAKHLRNAGTGDEIRDLWGLAHTGYEALFRLNEDDRAYVESRVAEVRDKSKKGITAPDAPVVGLHVRRGDRHPLEYQYHKTYIPAEVFHENARQLAETKSHSSAPIQTEPIILLASDDPMVYKEPDFASYMASQERIRLASKEVVERGKKQPKFIHHFVDEAFGWEGGFFAPMFWNLGVSRKNNAANAPEGVEVEDVNEEARFMAPPSEQTLKLRSLVGRAYMMDLAVLAQASDGVVCAVSAMGCRLLGVMMEWEKGVGGDGWVNVDGGYGWTGIDW